MTLYGTALFHLNLAYSSIDEERRGEVIARCYRPLLGLLDAVPGLAVGGESRYAMPAVTGLPFGGRAKARA